MENEMRESLKYGKLGSKKHMAEENKEHELGAKDLHVHEHVKAHVKNVIDEHVRMHHGRK